MRAVLTIQEANRQQTVSQGQFLIGRDLAGLGLELVGEGFADILALVKVVKSLSLTAEGSPTGKALGFDPTRIAYLGHSQGAGYGIPAVAHSPDLGFGIWSGAGAGLSFAARYGELTINASEVTQALNAPLLTEAEVATLRSASLDAAAHASPASARNAALSSASTQGSRAA